ncbi:MAG: hypothetical protein IT353_24455 [Gemmatimonadaceae bacterium]|nr:hypothetical protein [Gemmatimonadaceae bacterium]
MNNLRNWADPRRVFLLTYDRIDHLILTCKKGVVGVAVDGASCASKANRLQEGDWLLLRLTEYKDLAEHLLINPPCRVTGRPVLQRDNTPNAIWPELLWQEELEKQRMIYPMRIPVEFDDEVTWNPRITWDTLADLKLRGNDGAFLETPIQWGIKFACNVIDAPYEVRKVVSMIRRHGSDQRPP